MMKPVAASLPYNFIVALVVVSALWFIPGKSEALTISELDFTSGSIALKNGSTTVLSGNFTQNGQIVMGQYQPLPNIIAPIPLPSLLGTYTFSLFTSGPSPVPTGSTSGSTITADLNALFAKLTGPLLSPSGVTMNIGGNAVGTFNPTTDAFTGLSWTHLLTGVTGLPSSWGNPSNLSLQFVLNGTAQIAAVPLPGVALLFLSGLSGLALVRRRQAA